MKLYCHFCKEELVEKGAIFLSPPYRLNEKEKEFFGCDIVNKFHVCGLCYIQVMGEWKPNRR